MAFFNRNVFQLVREKPLESTVHLLSEDIAKFEVDGGFCEKYAKIVINKKQNLMTSESMQRSNFIDICATLCHAWHLRRRLVG